MAALPPNQSTGGGETALFGTVRNGDESLAAELIARGARVNLRSRGGNCR
jgi:hypothetical protein